MKKIMSFALIPLLLALGGCSNGGNTDIQNDLTTAETVREDVPTVSEETDLPQTTSEEVVEETVEETNPPLPEIEYVYLEDVAPSELYVDEEQGVMSAGIDGVILYETQWQDFTLQLTGDFVYKWEDLSEDTLFAGLAYIRMVDNEGNVRVLDGDGNAADALKIPINGRRYYGYQFFSFELDVSNMSDYLRIYTMTQNGREYPLIVTTLNALDESDYDATFFTVTESGELTGIYGFTDDEEIRDLILAGGNGGVGGVLGGLILSGDFLTDGERCTLVDKELSVRFSFDFENAAVTAEKAPPKNAGEDSFEFISGIMSIVDKATTVEGLMQAIEEFDAEGRVTDVEIYRDGVRLTEGSLTDGPKITVYYDEESYIEF